MRVAGGTLIGLALVASVLALSALMGTSPSAGAVSHQDPPPGPPDSDVPGVAPVDPPSATPEPDPGAPGTPGSPEDTSGVTTTEVDVVGPTSDPGGRSPTERANQRVQIVVISLVALAIIVAAATIVFWRRTSPSDIATPVGGGRRIGEPTGE